MSMTVKHYVLRAADGAAPALHAALNQLAQRLVAIDGVAGADLYRDAADADRFIFIERWQSEAHYAAGSQLIDKSVLKAVFAHLGAPPEVSTLNALSANEA